MKGKILLSGMLAGIICSMIFASDMDLIKNNPGLKCIRESGSPVTAMFTYNDDRCAICGDMDGNIIRITSNGYEKLKNTGFGRIDSIVLGKVSGKIAYFTVQGGSLYEHSKGESTINVSGAWGEKVKSVYKEKNSGTIYASTENGNLYMLSENGEWKEVPEGTIKNIIKEDAVELNRDSFGSDDSLTCFSSDGSVKFAYSKDGKIYADDQYEPKPMRAKVSYVSDAVSYPEKAIYRISIEGRRLVTNDKYKLDEIFGNGYNGFKYTLSCENDTRYDKDAYPILGAIYNSDGDKAALQNRKISFLWAGPKLKKDEKRKLIVKEWAYDFSSKNISGNSGMPKNIDHIEVDLPKSETYNYSGYEVSLIKNTNEIFTCPNGVCGQPFNILIIDDKGNFVPPEDKIYDHLVFYSARGTSPNKNGLIGCDPSKATGMDSRYIAIIPDSCAEVDNTYIKYAFTRNWKTTQGRRFYAYYNNPGQADIIAGLVHDGNLTKSKYVTGFSVIAKPELYLIPLDILSNGKMNNPEGRIFRFSQEVAGSNWMGDADGIGAGYLDYQLTGLANNGDKENQGVFVYLPEGYNTRPSQSRKDLRSASLTVGYYCEPLTNVNDPMLADAYNVNDTSSYCEKMRDKDLYAMLFDQYGRCALTTDQHDPDAAKSSKGENLWDLRKKADEKNIYNFEELNMIVVVQNLHKTPIIVSSRMNSYPQFAKSNKDKEYIKYGITESGVFLPPYKTGDDVKFITDKTEWLKDEPDKHTIDHFGISGHLFYNDEVIKILFANYFKVSWNGWAIQLQFAQLNSDGSWQDENKSFDSSKVRSCIAANIFHPAGVVTSQMRELYVVYAPEDKIKDKVTEHKLSSNNYKYTGEKCVVSGSACIAKFPADENWWPNTVTESLPEERKH